MEYSGPPPPTPIPPPLDEHFGFGGGTPKASTPKTPGSRLAKWKAKKLGVPSLPVGPQSSSDRSLSRKHSSATHKQQLSRSSSLPSPSGERGKALRSARDRNRHRRRSSVAGPPPPPPDERTAVSPQGPSPRRPQPLQPAKTCPVSLLYRPAAVRADLRAERPWPQSAALLGRTRCRASSGRSRRALRSQ